MTREEVEYLIGDAKAASRDKSGWDISRILREAAAELERLHRLPGGLLAEAPAAPVGRLFRAGAFTAHSGNTLAWKIACEALAESDWTAIAAEIATRFAFGRVVGIPRGGWPLAKALTPLVTTGPLLIIDDVLTTGASMEAARKESRASDAIGVVLFARSKPPPWVHAVFSLWQPAVTPAVPYADQSEAVERALDEAKSDVATFDQEDTQCDEIAALTAAAATLLKLAQS